MALAERCVKGALRSALSERRPELELLWRGGGVGISKGGAGGKKGGASLEALEAIAGAGCAPFAVMTYTEAVAALSRPPPAQSGAGPRPPPAIWGEGLSVEQERWLCENLFGGPVFVTNYPAAIKPFYMRRDDDSCEVTQPAAREGGGHGIGSRATVQAFDLLFPYIVRRSVFAG